MKKKHFVRTVISFLDNAGEWYCEPFICRSFLSLQQILDLSDSMLNSGSVINWSSFSLSMRFVQLEVYQEI